MTQPQDNLPAIETIEDDVRKMLVERLFLNVEPQSIAADADLAATLGVDSVAVFEIVVGLEELYGISFEDEEFDMSVFRDVASIAAFARRKIEGQHGEG